MFFAFLSIYLSPSDAPFSHCFLPTHTHFSDIGTELKMYLSNSGKQVLNMVVFTDLANVLEPAIHVKCKCRPLPKEVVYFREDSLGVWLFSQFFIVLSHRRRAFPLLYLVGIS